MKFLILFLRNPSYNEEFRALKLKDFLVLVLIYFLVMIPTGGFLFFLSKVLGIEHRQALLSFHEKIIYGILLAPLAEELLFRLILVFDKRNLIILLTTTLILTLFFVFKGSSEKTVLFSFLTVFYFSCIIYLNKCRKYFINHFRFFFYFLTILFAFLHIFNFLGFTISNLYFSPLFVIPQFFLGLILGYIRVKNGFIYALLFHSIINLTVLL